MKNIAIITGGFSGEDIISRLSAQMILNNIDRDLFYPYLIDISMLGWFCKDGEHDLLVDKNDFSIIKDGEKILFDAVFMALHGNPGENGVLQGYFDMLSINYTTGSAFNMAMTFNKYATVQLLRSIGLPVANSVLHRKKQNLNIDWVSNQIALPCFVKPNSGGSSIGISKVKRREELESAINRALKESDEVIVESFMEGREIYLWCASTWE